MKEITDTLLGIDVPEEKEYMPVEVLPPERNREANSTHRLSRLDLQRALTDMKRFVEARLESDFNLVKVRYWILRFVPRSYLVSLTHFTLSFFFHSTRRLLHS
jgi:hypothetical protein